MFEHSWITPTPFTPFNQLQENEVHVWRADLNVTSTSLPRYQALLSPEELTRAKRFYFERDRHTWTVAHGVLRFLLGKYLESDPGKITFQLNEYGKPSLSRSDIHDSFQFNLSHSKNLALFAFAQKNVVGVDVEYMSNISYEEVSRHSFSPLEQQMLQNLPQIQKASAFFKCWTSKEAYIKGRGMGLSLPLNIFDVSIQPEEPCALIDSREDPREVQRWQFYKLEPGLEYAGALAVEGKDITLRCWQWVETLMLS